MNNNRLLWRIIIGTALLAFLFFAMYQCKDKKLQQERAERAEERIGDVMKEKTAIIQAARAAEEREIEKRRIDSLNARSEQGALKRVISDLTKKIAKQPAVIYVNESKDTVKVPFEAITARDLKIVYQDSLIRNLESERDTIYLSFNRQLSESNKKFQASQEQTRLLETALPKEQALTRREARRKRFWKGVAVTATTIAVTLGIVTFVE